MSDVKESQSPEVIAKELLQTLIEKNGVSTIDQAKHVGEMYKIILRIVKEPS